MSDPAPATAIVDLIRARWALHHAQQAVTEARDQLTSAQEAGRTARIQWACGQLADAQAHLAAVSCGWADAVTGAGGTAEPGVLETAHTLLVEGMAPLAAVRAAALL